MRAALALAILLLALPAASQEPHRDFAEIHVRAARLVTLAPLCGQRDEAWARRLAQGVSAARRDVAPESQQPGLASAAFAVTAGSRLHETFGRIVCDPAADSIMLWRDADDLARIDAPDAPPLPRLPPAVPALGWQAFIAQLALRCDAKDRGWANAALSGARRAIALEAELAEDPQARRRMARRIVQTAEAMGNLVHGTHGAPVCEALRGNAALDQAQRLATQWRRLCLARRSDATCPLGQDR
jgi:hypothetical protein